MDEAVFRASHTLQVQLGLSRKDLGALYQRSPDELNRMIGFLVRHHSTALGENEPLQVGHAVVWERQEVTQGGQTGTLIGAVSTIVAQRFLPHLPDGSPVDEDEARDAISEVAAALVDQITEFGEDAKLRKDVIDAVVSAQPSSSTRVKKVLANFQIFGGVGGTLAGREARRDTLQKHLEEGKAVTQDPVTPSAPAGELRCPPLSVEPKSPNSLYCPNCGRGVGGLGTDGETRDERLVTRAGPCSHCKKLVCAACFYDRGDVGLPPSGAQLGGEV